MNVQHKKIPRKTIVFYSILIFLNIILLLGTYFGDTTIASKSHFFAVALQQFDLGQENVAASWYSSMLLFISFIASIFCFIIDKTYTRSAPIAIFTWGWLVVGVCFAILSFDEMGSIHEFIGDNRAFSETGSLLLGEKDSGWSIFYYLIIVVGMFMFGFAWITLLRVKVSFTFFILGLLCYLSNPFQENFEIDSFRSAADPNNWKRPIFFKLLEEGSEIFGSLFFFIATSYYGLIRSTGAFQPSILHTLSGNVESSKISWVGGLLICVCGILVLIVDGTFDKLPGTDQLGVPRHWAPAVMAMTIMLYAINRFIESSHKSYLFIALFCLVFSLYYGCNRLLISFGDKSFSVFLIWGFMISFAGLTLSSHNYVWQSAKSILFASGFCVFLVLALFFGDNYSTVWGYLSLSFLILTITYSNDNPPLIAPNHQ